VRRETIKFRGKGNSLFSVSNESFLLMILEILETKYEFSVFEILSFSITSFFDVLILYFCKAILINLINFNDPSSNIKFV